MKWPPLWGPRVPDPQRIPESSFVSLVAERLPCTKPESAAAGPRPPAEQGSDRSAGGTLPCLQYAIAAASAARRGHDPPRRHRATIIAPKS